MSRAVIHESFGGPEVLQVHDVPEPHAGPGQMRVRVRAAGLNPMDWLISSMPDVAAMFGVSVPAGFGSDFSGTIDEVGAGVDGFSSGDRVYGGTLAGAVADFAIVQVGPSAPYPLLHTPDGVDDATAAALPTPGLTASAALAAAGVTAEDTVLIGGAGGGVGVLAVQLAKLAGARVLGTGSVGTFDFLRQLGAEPVEYGHRLVAQVQERAPEGITAAVDLFGTETAEAALAMGVPPERISTIAAGPNPPGGVHATGGSAGGPEDLSRLTDAIVAGKITVPIAATFPIDQIQQAVALQADRHVHGKIVIAL